MIKLTYDEFMHHLESYGTAVHCEMYANNYSRYLKDDEDAVLYYDRGCVVKVNDSDYEGKHYIFRNVHQVTPDAAIVAVANEQIADAQKCASEHENPTVYVYAFTITNADLTPEQNQYYGWRNLARQGYPVSRDESAKILTEADHPLVKSICAPSIADGGDTRWGRQLANDFDRYDFAYHVGETMWGIFDGETLVGVATVSYEKGIDLAWLRDVFIIPSHRGKGYGKRLVTTAFADYPDKKWHYQAARDNELSIKLAKSLGFTLEGAGLAVYVK